MNILVVEDNPTILANVTTYLENLGYVVDCADNGATAEHLIRRHGFDVIVLDIMLPGSLDGYDLCRTIRDEGNDAAVIMLTAKDSIDDRLTGFDAGADDYLIKPFALEELNARIKAQYKRSRGKVANTRLQVGDLSFNLETMIVRRGAQAITLNPTLYKLLALLMQKSPKVVRREEIERHLWGDDVPLSDVLRSTMYMLRKKIDDPFDRPLLHTMRGIGFCLREETDG